MLYMHTISENPHYCPTAVHINSILPQGSEIQATCLKSQQMSVKLAWVPCVRSPSTVSQSPPLAPTFRIFTLLCPNNSSLSVKGKPLLLDCEVRGSSVHGILQARIPEWGAIPFSGDLPDPGIQPRSPALQTDSLLSESLQGSHQGKRL